MGMNAETVRQFGYTVTAGDQAVGTPLPPIPPGMNYALMPRERQQSRAALTTDPNEPPPQQTTFGGALPDELDFLSFSQMAKARSCVVTPSLADIQAVMNAVDADKPVLSVYFRQPFVLDEASGLRNAGAIVGIFVANDAVVMDALTGKFKPRGKLPFVLANSAEAIVRQAPDAPGYPAEDTLFPFGFGSSYPHETLHWGRDDRE